MFPLHPLLNQKVETALLLIWYCLPRGANLSDCCYAFSGQTGVLAVPLRCSIKLNPRLVGSPRANGV